MKMFTRLSTSTAAAAVIGLIGLIAAGVRDVSAKEEQAKTGAHGTTKVEQAELKVARDRLVREAGDDLNKENLRKAYRKIALRLNANLWQKTDTLEFQMQMLNL